MHDRGVDAPERGEGSFLLRCASYNYHLDPDSPSIDAGENQGAPSVDLDGRLRPNPSSSQVDIGCYEYYAAGAPPCWKYDYNGDGTSDIGIFRPSSGLWAIRGVTRVYFGSFSDLPTPGDYDGDGTTDIGIFRSSTGLWAIRSVTRAYFGSSSDTAASGDYTGDASDGIGIFRDSTGLWALEGISRIYFGGVGDIPVSR
ncbi:MAG: choice-of-anchor Q domain-containing protein [PVC group bacterium]